jgi:hypothetical protein
VHSFSAGDAERLPAYYKTLDAAVALLRSQLLETPPADPRRLRGLWGALQMGRNFRKLGQCAARHPRAVYAQRRRLVRSLVRERRRQGALRLRRSSWQLRKPIHPRSAYVLLHHVFGEVNGKTGSGDMQ